MSKRKSFSRSVARKALTACAATLVWVISLGPSVAYDRKDAEYVTGSKNKAVLGYIVCLESVVAANPKWMTREFSLDRAEKACKAEASKLPQSRKEPNAAEVRSFIMDCGFRLGEGRPDVWCRGSKTQTQAPVEGPLGSPSSPPAGNGQYILSDMEKNAIMNGVRARLKDPASAIFGGVVAKKDASGFVYVCGSINAKNSYGGYTGDKPYSGMLAGEGQKAFFAVLGIGGLEYESSGIIQVCHEKGLL